MASQFRGIISAASTVILKDIKASVVKKNYYAGNYRDISIPIIGSNSRDIVTYDPADAIFNKSKTNNPMNDVYVTSCSRDTGSIMATDNCTSANAVSGLSGKCHWCRRDTVNGDGLPILISIMEDEEIVVTIEDYYCDLRCCLALVEDELINPRTMNNHNWRLILNNIKFLHGIMCDDEIPIVPANHWRLLKINGGSLADEEWSEAGSRYCHVEGIIICPGKRMYRKT